MNSGQKAIVNYNCKWCKDTISAVLNNTEKVQPYNIFLSGPGGTGKSYVIKMIHHDIKYFFSKLPSTTIEDPLVLLTAFTGTAAFQIDGITLHSALHLPTTGVSKLSDEKLTVLCCKCSQLKLLIIDECSMVSAANLLSIHTRLCNSQHCSEQGVLFGNVSILAVGDLYQLPPVKGKPIFAQATSSENLSHLTLSLWENFAFCELTEVMRQKEETFSQILNCVQTGTPKEKSFLDTMLKACELHVDEENDMYPHNLLHVYACNKYAHE